MWHPEPGWQPLPGGSGTSTVGVWLAVEDGRELVVKRLGAPSDHDPPELTDPAHVAYWRRAADVALDGLVLHPRGCAGPRRSASRRTPTASPWSTSESR